MQVDWFTLVAQIVNFVILLLLLKHFLYAPIINAMEQREQKIADRLQEAEQKRSEADVEAQRYYQKCSDLEQEHEERLTAIQKQVEERRRELLDQAHQEVEEKKRNWQVSLREEQEKFLQSLCQLVGTETVELARCALEKMADVQIERHMAAIFVRQMEKLEAEKKAEIAESIHRSDRTVVIRSAFKLPQDLQGRIVDTVQSQILDGSELTPRFETSPNLIAGIEMQVDGHQVAWVIRDYLAGLEQQVTQIIQQEVGQQESDHAR